MTHNERYRIQGGDRIMEREVLSQSDREGKHGNMRSTASSPSPQEAFTEPLRGHSEHLPRSGHQGTSNFAPFSRETITQSFCITSPTFLKEI